MPRPLITIERIAVRRRDRWLLDGLSWRINCGEVWAVVGPNGGGKTTLAKAIAGLLPIVKGRIRYHDFGIDPPFKAVAYMGSADRRKLWWQERRLDQKRSFSGRFCDVTLVRDWLGVAQVDLCASLDEAPFDLVKALNVDPLFEKPILSLSTGELSRVLLAQTLRRRPKLLILDEPFDGMDQTSRSQLREMLDRVSQKGAPIVLITHRPEEEMLAGTTHVLTLEKERVLGALPKRRSVPAGQKDRQKPAKSGQVLARERSANRRLFKKSIATDTVVEMNGVTVRYGDTVVLDKVSWTVKKGEHWAVTGPNGAGKSTLVKLMTGECLQVFANRICLFGKLRGTGQTLGETRQQLGLVSHDLATGYQRRMTALDVVCSGFFDTVGLYRYCDPAQLASARQWMARLAISALSPAPFGDLSQGQRQMVLIARAMVKVPGLLILDEPCAGLDPENRNHVLHLVDWIAANTRTGLIFITHHEEEIPAGITHRLVLNRGKVDRCGRTEEASA